MKNLLRFLVLTTFLFTTTNFLHAQWVQTNGPLGGAIQTFAFNSSGHIFVGTEGGIFRSTDNGTNWAAVNNGLTNMLVNTLAVNSSGCLFAGLHGGGVYRSTNNGESWESMNNGVHAWVRALVINSEGHIFAGTHGGVYCSTDNGATWSGVNTGLTDTYVMSLAINPQGHVFAGTFTGGVYRSTDNGSSWIAINSGITQTTIVQIAINLNGNIFARTWGGVFRSTDNGETWTHLNNSVLNGAWYLAINLDSNIYVVSHGVYCSTNNGENWTTVNSGFTNSYINVLAINSNGYFFTGTSKGEVYCSTNNGSDWTQIAVGFANTNVTNLVINPMGDIFALTSSGVNRSTDNGESWTQVNNIGSHSIAINSSGTIFTVGHLSVGRSTDNGGSWTQIYAGFANPLNRALVINSNDYIFAGFDTCGVYRSTDNGENWTAVNNGLTNKFILALAVSNNGNIFAETVGADIYRSTDNGENWILVKSGLMDTHAGALAVNSKGDIFVASGGVYRSTDNGESWTSLKTGLPVIYVLSLTIDSRDYIFAADYGKGVFFSANNGNGWTEVNTGLTNKYVWSLATNPSNYIFAGTGGSGVWRRPLSEFTSYAISTSSNPSTGGTTTGSGTYNSGSSVTVTAAVNNGFTFTNWTENGNVVSTSSNYTFTINGDRTLIANFKALQFTITTSSNPMARGRTNGGGSYNSGSNVTVNAYPYDGYTYSNWTENGVVVSTNSSYTFTISGNRVLIANFTAPQFTVTTSSNPSSGGTTNGGGAYYFGNTVTLTATPNSGFIFTNWTENGNIVSTSGNYVFAMKGDRNLVANFSIGTTQTNVNVTWPLTADHKAVVFGNLEADSARGNVLVTRDYNIASMGGPIGTDQARWWLGGGNWPISTGQENNLYIDLVVSPKPGYNLTVDSVKGSFGGGGTGYMRANFYSGGTDTSLTSFTLLNETPLILKQASNFPSGTPCDTNVAYSIGKVIQDGEKFRLRVYPFYIFPNVSSTKYIYTQNICVIGKTTQTSSSQYLVQLSNNPSNGGVTSGYGAYDPGQSVTTTAQPNNGYTFTNWTENGNVVSTSSHYTFTISENRTLVANFTNIIYPPNSEQWTYQGAFPNGDAIWKSQTHSVAVDPDGKIWIGKYKNVSGFVNPATGKVLRAAVYLTYIFNPDGTQASFSPIFQVMGDTMYNVQQRGMRTNIDGNILFVSGATTPNGSIMYLIDYKTGIGLKKVMLASFAAGSATAPCVSSNGTIFVGPVTPGAFPLTMYDQNFNLIGTAIQTTKGFSRSFEVSKDGNTIYWAGYTNGTVHIYHRADQSSSFALMDSMMTGVHAESFTWHPITGNLWISAGSRNDMPTNGYSFGTWYAWDFTQNKIVDSLKWQFANPASPDERPRALAFSNDGKTAYAGQYGVGSSAMVQKFVKGMAGDYLLILSSNPSNGGITTGSGTYNSGQSFTATAIANNGLAFANWTEGGNVVSTSASYTSTISGNRTLIANFTSINCSALFAGAGSRIRVTDASPINTSANANAYKISGTSITVEAWVYPVSNPNPQLGNTIISRLLNTALPEPWQSYRLWISNSNGTSQPAFSISSGTPGSQVTVISPDLLPNWQWTHLAGTYDGNSLKIYVNGVLRATVQTNIAINSSPGVGLYIGGYSTDRFQGAIDDIRLWNITRSENDISSNVNNILQGNENGLVGYWNLDLQSLMNGQNIVFDKTQNHNDLIVQGNTPTIPFIPLKTYGIPTFSLNPSSINFGTLEQGSTSPSSILTMTNTGTSPLIGMFSSGSSNINFASSPVFYVDGGQTINPAVSVIPKISGQINESVTFNSNASSLSYITVTGTSIPMGLFDVNNISMLSLRNGIFAYNPINISSGLEWPKGSGKTAVYSSGIWIGANVDGNVRTAACSYQGKNEFAPGPIINGVAANPNDFTYRVYKIQKGDNASNNPDYANWPAQLGAPVNADGSPKIIGDQTLFLVYNDLNQSNHFYGSLPLGAEVQQTIFGFNEAGAQNNTVFLRFKIINKSTSTWNNTYMSLWSDPDLGNASDDLIGVDVGRNLGFIYNATDNDQIYGTPPPAAGYKILKGAFFTQPIQGFSYFTNGGPIPQNDPTNASQLYNLMQGLRGDGSPYIDPTTNTSTNYALSGDPVNSQGWLDQTLADKRFLLSTGPLNMEPGQSKEIIAAIVLGQGTTNINSVTVLRSDADEIQNLFDSGQIFGGALENVATVSVPEGTTSSLNDLSNSGAQITVTSGSGGAIVEAASYVAPPPGVQAITTSSIASVGKYLEVDVQGTVTWPIPIRIYYTRNDLLQAGIVESDLLGIYYWQGLTNLWKLYSDSGSDDQSRGPSTTWVDTTNVKINGIAYEGFVAANAYHLTQMIIAAKKKTITERYASSIAFIQALPDNAFKNPASTRRKQLADMLDQSKSKYISGNVKSASQYLEQNVLNHLTLQGKSDQDLWVTDAAACKTLTRMINELIDVLLRPQSLGKMVEGNLNLANHIEIPTEYSLSQNYPNPFNPITKINFGLPERSIVKLVVYDILGREVSTLVNQELEAGYHEVKFNAGNISSGVYFYQLIAGLAVETKKLIITK